MLIIWLACVQCCAGALERVCLSFGWRVCSAVRVHLSGCAYHLAGFVFRVWGLRFRVYGAAVGSKRDLPLAEDMARSQARCERSCAGVGKRDLPLAVNKSDSSVLRALLRGWQKTRLATGGNYESKSSVLRQLVCEEVMNMKKRRILPRV